MSNYLAIATVTSALKDIIQTGISKDLPGTLVTTVRPDSINNAQKERKVNLYMYQAIPNKEFNSSNSSSYKLNKGITKGKAVSLDLYYIISFYGNEQELEPQQLLGSTIKSLMDRPTVDAEIMESTLFQAKFLYNSTLSEQTQQIKFVPAMTEANEIVRIWSAMFKSPYALSIIYQGKGEIKLTLLEEAENLRPGIQNLQIIHYQFEQRNEEYITKSVSSNKIELVLRPKIVTIAILNLRKNWQQQCSGQIQIDVDLLVEPTQQVYLILNEINNTESEDYVFKAHKRNELQESLFFAIDGIKAASYLVRIKIDNADSLLEIDPITEEYCNPVIDLQS